MATEVQGLDTLKSLHRGEISATETYGQAILRLKHDPAVNELASIRNEHREFANELRQHVHELGEKPNQGSGVWGAWAKLVEGTATMLGRSATLKALKEGEEHGLKSYEDALKEDVPAVCKEAIRNTLLPRTRQHIAVLDQLMSS